MEVKIEKGVPMPLQGHRRPAGMTSAFKAMQVGDSFMARYKSSRGYYTTARLCGIRIRIIKVSEHEVRVWRIA